MMGDGYRAPRGITEKMLQSCLQPKPFDYEVSPVAKGVGRAGGTLYLFGGNEKSHCKEVSAERDGGLLPFL